MTTIQSQLETSSHPSRQQLLRDFGEADLSVQALFRFSFVPVGRLSLLKELMLEEDWGSGDIVLLKYLALHLCLSIEQGNYVWNEDQILMTAGGLLTRTGVPIYVGLVRNNSSDENPWVMNWVGERPNSNRLPEAPDLGVWPTIDPSSELVLGVELADSERLKRVPALETATAPMRTAAILGAVHWAFHRGLIVPHQHRAVRGYFIPIYLGDISDLCAAPDLICSVLVQRDRTLVRTLLDPHIAYSPARAVVSRSDELPPWLLEAWDANELGDEEY